MYKRQIQNLLRIGVAELLFHSSPSFAVVNEVVEITKDTGAEFTALVNAVLRKIARKRDYYSAIPVSYTHLDVYKRQGYRREAIPRLWAVEIAVFIMFALTAEWHSAIIKKPEL